MTIKLGIVMDPIESIHYEKDSTLAMLWEAKARGWEIYYFEQPNLYLRDGVPYGQARRLNVFENPNHWFELGQYQTMLLTQLDAILMRKDPPVDQEYIYTTYLLEHAAQDGVLVVNHPRALRDANEKMFATHFPECAPPTLVTQSVAQLKEFWHEHHEIVCKPLDAMGGASVFHLSKKEMNANAIFEILTQNNSVYIMAQNYIPAIKHGDKRILLIDGHPVPHALVRVPQGDDWRGNLAAGAKGVIEPLTERDHYICDHVGPVLREKGLYFVGLDVIGDYLTEINVTSPTGIRELDKGLNANISGLLMDVIEEYTG